MTHEDAHYLLRLIDEQEERSQQIRNVVVNYMMRQGQREVETTVVPFPPQLRVEPSRYPFPDEPEPAA